VEARFSASIQTGPGAHPASHKMVTGYFPGVRWPGRGVAYPPTSSAEVKHSIAIRLPPSRPTWSILRRTSPFHFTETYSDSTVKVTIRLDIQTARNI
jgi:hypothetical protein